MEGTLFLRLDSTYLTPPPQVSFFEWVQNLQHFVWEEDEVNRKLEKKMKASFQSLWGIASSQKARADGGVGVVNRWPLRASHPRT